jgi:TetR/AcrR family transcriptional regulator, transcriptional repressor for nem operon
LGYLDLRVAILQEDVPDFTCLLGTLVQEVYATHPMLREACDAGMTAHIQTLTHDIAAAKKRYAPRAKWTPESVGYFIQSVLQGSFIFAKAKQGSEMAKANLVHLKYYLETLLPLPATKEK